MASVDDPVTSLDGIAKGRATSLATFGIQTVGQLSKADANQIKMPGIANYIYLAKKYIESIKEPVKKMINLGGLSPQDSEDEDDQEEKEECDEAVIFIENHSWFESKCKVFEMDEDKHVIVRDIIVYELTLEHNNRVSFLCSWAVEDENGIQKMCEKTYSPQALFFYNTDILPELILTISEDDCARISNMNVLLNVLTETNTMRYSFLK